MALFSGSKEAEERRAAEQTAEQATGVEGDAEYFDGLEGQGLDSIDQNAVSTAYLSMVQPGSTAISAETPAGTWRNSATNDSYGPTVQVIPLAFKTVWTERDNTPPFMTVGRYEPNSIEVRVDRPKPGTRGFPKMTNPETGNKVEELFIYACTLEDYPEAGVLYFSPTASSMKACKQWNSQLRSQRLPNGKLAPIFAFSWSLQLELVQNPNQPANLMAKFVRATRGNIVNKDLFFGYVQPAIAAAQNIALLAAPEQSGDAEE
jgi:hypothetical protein